MKINYENKLNLNRKTFEKINVLEIIFEINFQQKRMAWIRWHS